MDAPKRKRSDDIREFVEETLRENGIEATDENRLVFMQGMQDAWKDVSTESLEESIEKSMYSMALSGEIFALQMKELFNRPPFNV